MFCILRHRLLESVSMLSLLLIGCASVPPASPEFERKAMEFSPPEGRAGIYVLRQHNLIGSAVLFMVSFDYKDFGTVSTDTYLYAPVAPGEHIVRVGGGIPFAIASTKFNAEVGRLYFFEVSPGWSQIKVESISEADGRLLLRRLRLSGDNAYEIPDDKR